MNNIFKFNIIISLFSFTFYSLAGTSTNSLPPTYDLSNAKELNYAYYSKMSKTGSYIIEAPFKAKNDYCYTSNDKLELQTRYGIGYALSRVLCKDNVILEANDNKYKISAFVAMNKVLDLHFELWGEDLFQGKAKIYHEDNLSVNSSYVYQSDAFYIRTNENGAYGSAYIDITVMAHEAGHKFTKSLLLNDGSIFYESVKEGIADLYAIVIHNNYLEKYQGNTDENISWLIALGGTPDSKSGAIRDVSNPIYDIPSSNVDNISKISKNNSAYQNSAVFRSLFHQMSLKINNNINYQSKNTILFNLFNAFKAVSIKLSSNTNANDFIHILIDEMSKSEYSHIDFLPIYKSFGWDV
ncbi:hypothetical protein [Moritella viscosa]|uniref:Zinc metalloproteinase aureolysin n=1 Tax=Moritella viscosa TaxID=80854 RepID=A0ABY1HAF4_9GAMM|nr:hypothetical protein [Moritella viscosa]SGY81304.1 Zinc metalloproteinase aureolysin [Moritella viscosa]SGY81373.1 Zinc metalloproteinase aureolysin [Moritella viscosa]SHO23979.1 Zinc metalloproteinase aureolysin [Moritella viscosa]